MSFYIYGSHLQQMALEAISTMDLEINGLEKQLQQKIGYESEWSYDQLVRGEKSSVMSNTFLTFIGSWNSFKS